MMLLLAWKNARYVEVILVYLVYSGPLSESEDVFEVHKGLPFNELCSLNLTC